MERGIFLVFEGVEGSGKSTQASLLGEWLAARGVPHVLTREPGGTEAGEEIRRILLHGGEVGARAELLLMLAARSIFVEEVVEPALRAGKDGVADRYELSTLAYQGYARGLPLEEVRRMNAFATGGLKPALTIVLDVPFDVGVRRRSRRNADRIERAGREFHERVAEAYRLLPERESGVIRLDGTGSPDQVHEAGVACLGSRFPETFRRTEG